MYPHFLNLVVLQLYGHMRLPTVLATRALMAATASTFWVSRRMTRIPWITESKVWGSSRSQSCPVQSSRNYLIKPLQVEGEGVVEQGDVELSDFCFTSTVALCVCVNRDLRGDNVI